MTCLFRTLVALSLIIPSVGTAQKVIKPASLQAEHCIGCHGYESYVPGRPIPRAVRHTADWSLAPGDLKVVLAQHPGYHASKFDEAEIRRLASDLATLRLRYSVVE